MTLEEASKIDHLQREIRYAETEIRILDNAIRRLQADRDTYQDRIATFAGEIHRIVFPPPRPDSTSTFADHDCACR